jgi:uncharacterized protein
MRTRRILVWKGFVSPYLFAHQMIGPKSAIIVLLVTVPCLAVSVSGLQRTAIVRLINNEFLAAEVAPIEEGRGQSAEAATLSRAVLDAYQIYANVDFSALPPEPRARFGLPSIGDPSLLADTVAPLLSIGIEKKQQLLETSDVVTRLETILDLMNAGRPTN